MNKLSSIAFLVPAFLISGCFANLAALNQQEMQRLCSDPQAAYERGYNQGHKRQELNTRWIDSSCAPEVRDTTREHYLAGFDDGSRNAPAVVEIRGARGGLQSCTFDNDCGAEMSCRDWHGENVCMGYGAAGDPCWFGKDCLSGSCNGIDKVCR